LANVDAVPPLEVEGIAGEEDATENPVALTQVDPAAPTKNPGPNPESDSEKVNDELSAVGSDSE